MLVKFKNITNVTYTHLKNVVSSDNLRPVMCGVYIDFKEQKLVAIIKLDTIQDQMDLEEFLNTKK